MGAFEAELTSVVRGLTVEIWKGILVKTPQYYGRMAASWSYSIGTPEYTDRSSMVPPVPDEGAEDEEGGPKFKTYYRGHRRALEVANSVNAGRDQKFRLGDVVWIANGVDHGEGGYSQDIEDGNVNLYRWNLPGRPVSRTLDQVEAKYRWSWQYRLLALKEQRLGS